MAGKKTSKKLWLEVQELVRSLRGNAYQLTTRLCAIFDDRESRADLGAADDFTLIEMFDQQLADLNVKFLELRSILQMFPNETDWRGKSLRELYQATADAVSRKSRQETDQQSRNRVTLKEHEELKEEKRHFEARAKYLETQLSELQQQNRELQRENAKLQGRLEELERLLDRQAVTA